MQTEVQREGSSLVVVEVAQAGNGEGIKDESWGWLLGGCEDEVVVFLVSRRFGHARRLGKALLMAAKTKTRRA